MTECDKFEHIQFRPPELMLESISKCLEHFFFIYQIEEDFVMTAADLVSKLQLA